MKTKLSGIGKWLGLAVFVLTAGLCYSCGTGGQAVSLACAGTTAGAASADAAEGASETEASEAGQSLTAETADAAAKALVPGDRESTALEPVRTCFVHVCGAVVNPGVYELEEGQRVFEAVELAGGFAGDAAADYLNLAEPVGDGMKIFVPNQDQVQEVSPGALQGSIGAAETGGTAGTAAASRVNINTASKEELMTLKGIGEARAEDIIQYRQQRGGFDSIEDIMEVSGIKNAAFQKIKDDITV